MHGPGYRPDLSVVAIPESVPGKFQAHHTWVSHSVAVFRDQPDCGCSVVGRRPSRTHNNTKRYQSANVNRASVATSAPVRPSATAGQAWDSSPATDPVKQPINRTTGPAQSSRSPNAASNTAGKTPSVGSPLNRISRRAVGSGSSAVPIVRYTRYMLVTVLRLFAQDSSIIVAVTVVYDA